MPYDSIDYQSYYTPSINNNYRLNTTSAWTGRDENVRAYINNIIADDHLTAGISSTSNFVPWNFTESIGVDSIASMYEAYNKILNGKDVSFVKIPTEFYKDLMKYLIELKELNEKLEQFKQEDVQELWERVMNEER